MPYSSTEGKKEIKEWFEKQDDIKTIIDAGCGSGTYKKLLPDNYHWIGIEIYEPYIEQFDLMRLYDEIIVANFLDVIETLEADCLIFGDVLEHLTEEEVIKAIQIADQKFKHVVISIPLEYPQEATENPHEEHKSIWSMEKINSLIPESFSRGVSWNIAIFIK